MSRATTVYLIRHAEAEGNLYRRIHGWYDSLITRNGYQQTACLAARFRNIHVDAVYTSGLRRTEITARSVYRTHGLPLHTDPDLRELHMGDWEDIPWGWARQFDGDSLTAFNRDDSSWRAPHGENLFEVGARVSGSIRRLALKHPGQTICLFSHGTAIRMALAAIEKVPPEKWPDLGHSDNTAVSKLEFDGRDFRVLWKDDASHVPDHLSTLRRQAWWRKGSAAQDVNLWYRPLDPDRELDFYLDLVRESWERTIGTAPAFDPSPLLRQLREDEAVSPETLMAAMAGEERIGVLHLSPRRFEQEGAGAVTFLGLTPDYRGRSLAIQLVGQAVHYYRPLGRDSLRLQISPADETTLLFAKRYGFEPMGQSETVYGEHRIPLETLSLFTGYQL